MIGRSMIVPWALTPDRFFCSMDPLCYGSVLEVHVSGRLKTRLIRMDGVGAHRVRPHCKPWIKLVLWAIVWSPLRENPYQLPS